jgi:hypothetical protein
VQEDILTTVICGNKAVSATRIKLQHLACSHLQPTSDLFLAAA